MYIPDPNHDKAVEMALAQNESYGRMIAALDREPNIFTAAAIRLGRVAPDYKVCGIAMRPERERNDANK